MTERTRSIVWMAVYVILCVATFALFIVDDDTLGLRRTNR